MHRVQWGNATNCTSTDPQLIPHKALLFLRARPDCYVQDSIRKMYRPQLFLPEAPTALEATTVSYGVTDLYTATNFLHQHFFKGPLLQLPKASTLPNKLKLLTHKVPIKCSPQATSAPYKVQAAHHKPKLLHTGP
jgi:hypothetical protein